MAASSDSDTESSFVVITCKGNVNDHDLTQKLQKIKLHLSRLSESDDELLSISKVEPWNSVRVTFNIPPEAAQRLQHLAQNDSQLLQNLGILSVQVENNDLVNIPQPQASTPVSQHVQPPFSVGLSPGHSAISSVAPTSSPMRMTVANHQQSNVMNPLNFGGMRPNLQWSQVQVPRMQGNIPSGMQGNIQVGIPPTLQGSIPSGMQPGIQAGIQLNMQGSMQPGVPQNVQGGMQPGMHANMQTGIQGNIQPGITPPNMQGNMQSGMPPGLQTSMQSGRQPGMQGNVQPGMQGNVQPGMQGNVQPGMQQGMHANMQPGMQGGMQPGMQVGMQPGMQGGMPPGMQGNMQPGIQGGMQGGMQIPPGMQGGMQPGIQGGMQPAMQGGMQSGMQPNMPQGMQQGMNPNVPPFNQMSQFFFQGEMPMQRFGLNMSPPADARPKKKRRSRPKTKKKNAEKDKDMTKSPESQLKEADSPQTTGEMKTIVTPPPSLANNQMSPTTNTNQSNINQNQQAPTSLPFAEPMQPRSTTSTPPIKKPDVSITSPLLVNLLQREIPGTQFPFRGIVPSSLANTVQQGVVNPKKPMNNLPQSTLSQGLPPMPPASEITRMLPESIGLPPLPTNQSAPVMSSSQMSSSQSTSICSQIPNRQPVNTINQPVPTQHFQSPSNTTQMNQPISDATHNLFATSQNVHSSAALTNVSAQQNMPTLANSSMAGFTTVSGMPLQQPSSVMQPIVGVPFGHIEQARQTPTPLSNNMSPPVRLSGMQSPGPNNLPFTTPGMINTSIAHGMPTALQQAQAQALSSSGPTSVYQQGMNQMIHQGQRQFPAVTSQIRNQLPFALQVQQQSQIHQLNQYLPSNINQQANAGQTPTNQGVNFPQGTNFNQGHMFHQRPQVSGNMPFNMVNIPVSTATANLPQFRMATPTELPHVSGKGGIPGTGRNVMQTGPMSLISGSTNKLPVRPRGNQQMPHSTHLPPTSITFPSIPRFPVKPPSKNVMPFDETTLDGISDAEKDLLAMAEKVANEAGMETSNRMANLFSKDSSRDEKQTSIVSPKDLLTRKDSGHLKMSDFVKTSGNEEIKDVKSDDHEQKKPPVIQLTKQPHDLFTTTGDTQHIASWSSTILPIHGKEGYSLHTHTPSMISDKKTVEQVDRNNQQKAEELIEGGVANNSQTIKSTFCLPSDGTSKLSSSQTVVQGAVVGVPVTETGAHYVSIPRGEVPYHNINFLSQFNPGAVSDKKLDNPHLAGDEFKNRNKHQSFGTNFSAPSHNLNQGPVPEQKVSDKSSILMQMMNMDSSHDNPGMMSLTRTLSEPVGNHGGQTIMPPETIHTDSNKMPILERMPTDSESNPTQYQQENGADVVELNAKQAVPGLSQPLMPQLMPKQPPQQQKVNIYSPKSLLLPSCMPPPTHGSTGNLVNPESQKPASSAQFNKRSRSVSPVTQQGSEFPRLPLGGGQFIKQTQSPTTSSPSGMGMSASALLSSIAKSAYNAGMTPRMQSPSESRPSTSQPIGLPPNTSAPSPTGLPLYANPLGPDAHTKPITVRVSPVPTPEVIKSTATPLLPSVLPIASQSSKISESTDKRGYSNLSSSVRTVEMKQAPVTLTQITHLEEPPKSSIPHKEITPVQPPSSNLTPYVPIQEIKKEESTPSVGQSKPDISIGHSQCSSIGDQLEDVETSNSKQELSKDSSAANLKRKHDNDAPSDNAPKVLRVESDVTTNVNQVKTEDDSSELQNTQQTDGEAELSGDHRPLPLLVRESNIEVGKTFTGNDGTSDDPSLMDATTGDNDDVVSKEVLTMPTLLPSKVELTDIAKCKDSKFDTAISLALETTSNVVEGSRTAGDTTVPLPPKDLPVQSDVTKTDIAKDTTESKQEETPSQMDSKQVTTSATTSKSPTETSPASSKDCTKSSPVERRTTPKRKAAEEASRPVSERTAQSRQCTNQQVDEPPATRARRTTRNKSPTDHPTRLREREREDSIGSCRDQHTDPGTDNDGRMTRKRSTRIFGKGNKDSKEK